MKKRVYVLIFLAVLVILMFGNIDKAKAASPQPVPTPSPSPLPTLPPDAKLSGWDCVDSGKHLDYKTSSVYKSNVEDGVAIWESYKKGVIRKANLFRSCDLEISDMTQMPGRPDVDAVTIGTGKIIFFTNNMNKYTNQTKTHVAAHEIGHALGMDDRYEARHQNHMMYGITNYIVTLCQVERLSYDYLYANVY